MSTTPVKAAATPDLTTSLLLNDRTYNLLKLTAQFLLPAISALYFGLAQIWGLPAGAQVNGTVAVVNVFVGAVVLFAAKLHEVSGVKFDGTFAVEDNDEGTALKIVDLDPTALRTKNEVIFKLIQR